MSQPRTIGIDARFYGEAGPGRYAKDILQHLELEDVQNKYIVFLRSKGFELYKPKNPNFTKVLANYKWYTWQEQIQFLFNILKYKLDLFYVPHFNIPVLYPGKLVTAIPDIIMHSYSTEKGSTLPKPYFKFKKLIYKFVVWWAVVRSFKVIVPSKDVISDFRKVFPAIPESKYILAYEGIDPDCLSTDITPEAVMNKFEVKKPFLLYVSSMYEHKNVPRLLDAFQILAQKHKFEGKLILVGKKDKYSEEVQRLVVFHKLGESVLIPGMSNYVSDAEIVALRKAASVYVFPSLKEGFSLTPLEAQAMGLPCAISDIPCHREIYGDSVLYFDPYDPDDIAEKVSSILKDDNLKNSLRAKGLENIKKYDWKKTASITYSVFIDALKNL